MASSEGTLSPRDRGDQGDHEAQGQTVYAATIPKEENGSGGDAEVFCGRIPKDMTEVELKTLFIAFGPIKDVRVPKFPVTGIHKGFAFINFERREDASKAINKMNGRQVRHRHYLKVSRCLPNTRLFVGNIPKAKGKDELFREFSGRASGLRDVIIYSSPDDGKKNRGFCFLDYGSHKDASSAKRKLSARDTKIFGCDIMVDWADPEQEPDADTMSKVQILYVRNISAAVNEEELRGLFSPFGTLDRVKKIKDFAFIHFATREDASKAKDVLNGHKLCGVAIEIQWAKPPTTKDMRQAMLRARERRILVQHYLQPPRGVVNPFPLPPITWEDDYYIRRDRGDDHQNNQGPPGLELPTPVPPGSQETRSHYLTPAENLERFYEATPEPFDHFPFGQHQLPRIPSHVFLLSDDDDGPPMATTGSGGFNRGRNNFEVGIQNNSSNNRESGQRQNWKTNGNNASLPPPTPQRHREWTNQAYKNRRRHSEAENTENWRARP